MKLLLSLVFCTAFIISAKGQTISDQIITQGDQALARGDYKTAINKYYAAEAFDPNKKNIVKEKMIRVFASIEALKLELAKCKADALKQKPRG